MKILIILSVFFLSSVPTFAAAAEERDATEVVEASLKALLKCDATGITSAKMAMGFMNLMITDPREQKADATQAGKDIDGIIESFESAKTCADYQATYAKILAFAKTYEAIDIEAELAKPEAKEMLELMAAGIREQKK